MARFRAPVSERVISRFAIRTLGFPSTHGLDDFADQRAAERGDSIRADLDADRETAEELADARNYLVWGITKPGTSAEDRKRQFRALGYVILAWRELKGVRT